MNPRRIEVDSLIKADYILSGGSGNDTIKIINEANNYLSAKIHGGSGEDLLFGGMNDDTIYGDADPDIILGYDGEDTIYGGDEEVAYYYTASGEQRAAIIYRTDGTAFDAYNDKGKPVDANGAVITAGTITVARLGDIIDGGSGIDELHGGKGVDEIVGGVGNFADVIYGDAGTDILKLAGPGRVYGGADSDRIILTDPEALTGSAITVDGGAGRNTLVAELSNESEVLHIFGDVNNLDTAGEYEKLVIQVGSVKHSLENISRLTIDAGDGADKLNIDNLLNTEVSLVEIDLGSVKAKAWQAARNGDGEQLTVATEYPLLQGQRLSAADGAFDFERDGFYQLELNNSGKYAFDADGNPIIETLNNDYRIQSIELLNDAQLLIPTGSTIIGYKLNGSNLSSSQSNPVDIAADYELAIETIDGINDVDVTAVDGGYRIDILDADLDPEGNYPEIELTVISEKSRDLKWQDLAILNQGVQSFNFAYTLASTTTNVSITLQQILDSDEQNQKDTKNNANRIAIRDALQTITGMSSLDVRLSDDQWEVVYADGEPNGDLNVTSIEHFTQSVFLKPQIIALETNLKTINFNYDGKATGELDLNGLSDTAIEQLIESKLAAILVIADVSLSAVNDVNGGEVKRSIEIDLTDAPLDLSGQFTTLEVIKDLSLLGEKVQTITIGSSLKTIGAYYSAQQTALLEELTEVREKREVYEADSDGNMQPTGEYDWFQVNKISADHLQDELIITGTADNDKFTLSHFSNDAGTPNDDSDDYNEWQTLNLSQTNEAGDRGVSFVVRGIDLSDNDPANSADIIRVRGGDGEDTIDASGIIERLVDNLYLEGQADNDRIVGSKYAESIDGGSGDDTITGGAGVDVFFDSSGYDTLIEQRDLNFKLTDMSLRISGVEVSQEPDTGLKLETPIDENENLKNLFESVRLTGGASDNKFLVSNFTAEGWLDGSEGGDTYLLKLTGTPDGKSLLRIQDQGTGNETDKVSIWGDNIDDFFQLDVDKINNLGIVTRTLKENATELFSRIDIDSLKNGSEQPDTPESASDLFANVADYQRVYYDLGVENVAVHGGKGNDMFVSDYTLAAMSIYGDEGNDDFIVGRVIDTTTMMVNGKEITVVNGANGITDGVSFNAKMFGGKGNDYFEVNHNVGILSLYGESGNDWFYLKTLLQKDGNSTVSTEENAEKIDISGSYDQAGKTTNDKDVLISYVNNNRISISGGSGFDTLVLGGTALADTVYIYEAAGSFRIYVVSDTLGSGQILEGLDNVENVAILTGQGDDEVYLYGLPEDVNLTINLGLGEDTVYVGGEEKKFTVSYPASSYTENVEHTFYGLDVDTTRSTGQVYDPIYIMPRAQIKDDDVKEFYERWFNGGTEINGFNLDSTRKNLLAFNILNSMKLFSRAMIEEHTELFHRAGNRLWTPGDAVYYGDTSTKADNGWNSASRWGPYDNYYHGVIRPFYANINGLLAETYSGGQGSTKVSTTLDDFYAKNIGTLLDGVRWNPSLILGLAPPSGPHSGFDGLQKSFKHYLMTGIQSAFNGYAVSTDDPWIPDMLANDVANTKGNPVGTDPFNGFALDAVKTWGDSATTAGANSKLWYDALSLLFEIRGIDDGREDAVVDRYKAIDSVGEFSYRFDLPELVSGERIMPETYDLSKIAGFVEIRDSVGGNDKLVVNAKDDSAIELELDQLSRLTGDYAYDKSAISGLSDAEKNVLIETLENMNFSTDQGILNRLLDGSLISTNVDIELEEKVGNTFADAEQLRTYLDANGYESELSLRIYRPDAINFSSIKADYRHEADNYRNDSTRDAWVDYANKSGKFSEVSGETTPPNLALDGTIINPSGKTLKEIRLFYTQNGVNKSGVVRANDYSGNSELSDEERVKSAALQFLSDLNNGYYTLPFFGVDSSGNEILDAMAIGRLADDVQYSSALTDGVYITQDSWADFYQAVMGSPVGSLAFTPDNVDDLIRNGLKQTEITDVRLPIQQGLILNTSVAGNPEEVYIQTLFDGDGLEIGFELFTEVTKTVQVSSDFVTGRANDRYDYFDVISGETGAGIW
ncbi:calcium-binding protein [sulfur-oxidizing endosymbiont of Gigantopelta aegis]|uniref:calcium-binding protein n=1 Tax=sulfur-oxidizing endosymbiont of Gigantopelta aegis TaxID=2794934 RepID=UPI0018DCA2F0|nr:calcium-binding protein [sulfur-oxidizing endosymbiont of Gigantopelta aegis]